MESARFRLVRFDEGGVNRNGNTFRLVCVIESGGKLAIWGDEGDMRNIEAVGKAGMPCTVECEYRTPEDWGVKYGHTHWVPQHQSLRVIS